MLTAAIVGAEVHKGSALEACLWQTGVIVYVRHWTLDRPPGPGASAPDLVILDLSEAAESCLAFAARLRELHPKLLMLSWTPSQPVSAELLLSAMRSGVQDFLPDPVDPVRLRGLLLHFAERATPKSGEEPKVIVIMGVKGGTGATTVASNLGVQLARLTQKRVSLLDFARPFGQVALFLDLQPRFCIRDAVENLARLDDHFFGGLLVHHESGLSVLAGTSHPDDWQSLPTAALSKIVNVAQSSCDFVLIDLKTSYAPTWSSVLNQAHTVIMVTDIDVANLSNLERHLSGMASLGVDAERVKIVVNRWHPHYDNVLKAFRQKTECSILGCIPNDFPQVSQAITRGEPLSRDHRIPLRSRFEDLARQVAGFPTPAEQRDSAGRTLFGSRRGSTERIPWPWRRTAET